MAKRQCGRCHDVGWWRRLSLPSQDVEHDIGGMDAVTERFGTGGFYRRQTVGQHRIEVRRLLAGLDLLPLESDPNAS